MAVTTPTTDDVDAFLSDIADPGQCRDCESLRMMMHEVSGQPATVWGSAIVGFGRYHYRYVSGREGDTFRIGFSPRKQKLSVYLAGGANARPELLAHLGKHKTGAGCLWIRRLSDVDMTVVRMLCLAAMAWQPEQETGPAE